MLEARPVIKNWSLETTKVGKKELEKELRKFADFLEETTLPPAKFKFSFEVMLAGYVYGKETMEDGEKILTSKIRFFDKIDPSLIENPESIGSDLITASTKSGSKYFLVVDQMSAIMELLLENI